MKQFTFSDMNRASGEVLETALVERVGLTKHGKWKLVILRADAYEHLKRETHTTAYLLEDAPEEIHDELMAGIDAIPDDVGRTV